MDNPKFVFFLLLNNVLWCEVTVYCLHFYLLNRINLDSFDISYLIFPKGKKTFLLALVKFLQLFENLECLFIYLIAILLLFLAHYDFFFMQINKQCSIVGEVPILESEVKFNIYYADYCVCDVALFFNVSKLGFFFFEEYQ